MPVNWKDGIGGSVSDGFVAENLNLNEEYVLQLVETDYNENVSLTFQGDTQVIDRFKTVWQVDGHKTKVWVYFNLPVGYLKGLAGPNEKSNVVKFAKRFHQIDKAKPFRLSDFFEDNMRIRAYLKKQEKSDYYNLDLDTVVPYNVQKKPADDQDVILMKKALALCPNQEEAWKFYKEMVPSPADEGKFLILWNMVLQDKTSTPGQVIDGDTGKKLP
jgi:hypothetical protein